MQPQWIPHVGVLLFDPVHANRHLTRNALFTLGFRTIETPVTPAELKRALETSDYDLCILDVTDQLGYVCELIEALRHGRLGRNPFQVVLATSWIQSAEVVRKVIDAGADDVILRPLSVGALKTRITLQVESRKDFVVTSTYIGPDRRRDPNRGPSDNLVQVPNSLRAKAAQGLLGGANPEELAAACRQVERQRLHQSALRIGIGAQLIGEHLAAGLPAGVLEPELAQLSLSALDLKQRAKEPHLTHLVSLCDAALQAIEQIRTTLTGPAPGQVVGKRLELLSQLSLAVRKALDPGCDAASVRQEISDTLARVKGHRGDTATPEPRSAQA